MSEYPDQIVYIIDDDCAVRDSVDLLLKSAKLKTRTFASAQEFLDNSSHTTLGCIVLDIQMPGMTGLELQATLGKLSTCLPIIFITGHGDVPMAVKAIKDGAFDFLQKPFDDNDLIQIIHRALDTNQKNSEKQQYKNRVKERLDSLTPREQQVIQALLKGHANKMIAAELGLSQRTIEVHRSNIMHKMQVKNLTALIYLMQA